MARSENGECGQEAISQEGPLRKRQGTLAIHANKNDPEEQMEFLYEAIVMGYLTRGTRFCCPQYTIKPDSGKGEWRCSERVIIAEVTTAADLGDFVRKAVELHDQGREKVRKQLRGSFKAYPNIAEWPIEIHLFVREDRKDDLLKIIDSRKLQFKVFTLEHAFRRWKWDTK